MGNSNKILTALGVGLAAGAILGVLFAPRKGKETRDLLNKKGRKLSEDIKDGIAESQRKLNTLRDGFKESRNNLEKKLEEVM